MRNLGQDITIWRSTPDGYGGFSWSTPEAAKGRWEDKAELFKTSKGEEIVSRAIVYLDTSVTVNDYLFLGTSIITDPTAVSGTELIKQFDEIPDLRNLQSTRKAYI